MLGFNHNGNAARVNLFLDRFRDLGGQAFLDLKAPGVHALRSVPGRVDPV